MKKTFQKIWYIFSVILIIAGMILILPGAMYGGDDTSESAATSTSEAITTTAAADTTTTVTSGEATTTVAQTETSATTTAPGETTTTIVPGDNTATTAPGDTTTTIDAGDNTATTAPGDTTTTMALTETSATSTTTLIAQNTGSVILTRTSNGAAATADFYLKDLDGKYYTLTGIAVSKEDVLAKQSLSNDGVISWSGLPGKTYKIEIDPISGYVSAAAPDTFTIDSNNIIQLVTLNITSSSQETTTSVDAAASKVSSETIESTTTTLLADTTPPVITLTGEAVINLIIGETFTDPGATVADDIDTSVAITTSGSVDTSKIGSYTLSYDATDAAGNAAAAVTRTVNVAELPDTTAPEIILNGDAAINLKIGDTFTDPGATVTDNKDESVSIITTGTVDTSKIGSYTLSYDATDTAGNPAVTVTRTVNVTELIDTTPPLIVLNGDAVINLKIGDIFTDPGATATDNKGASIAVTTIGTVNTNFASSYTISYNATDTAGNIAATVMRTVNVTSIATVVTDKPDYMPTDYVLVTGSGWLPGETVKLDFHETLIDLFQQTITYYTVADSAGNIRDIQYLIELRHLGASFILTATGITSGLTSKTVFTDSRTATNYYLYVTYNTGAATETQGFQASINPGSAIHFDVTRGGGTVVTAVVKDGRNGGIVATWTGNGSEHNNQGNVSSAYWHWIWNGNVLTISDSSTITPNYGSVKVRKLVDGEVPNTGASFSFYYTVDGNTTRFTLNSSNNWTHSFSVLVDHNYVLVEEDPGPGWGSTMIEKISGSIVFNINESTRTVTFTPHCEGELVFNNTKDSEGFIKIKKNFVDQNNAAINVSGSATFKIYDNIDLTGTPITKTINFNASSSETATVNGLILNHTYYVVENSTTVEGAQKDDSKEPIIALAEGSALTVTFVNTKNCEGFIKIKKDFVDQNNAALSVSGSATFNIYDNSALSGTPITKTITFTNSSSETATVNGLILNHTYYIKEVSTTVGGAQIDTSTKTVTALAEGSAVTVTFKNTKNCEGFIKITKVFKDQNNDPISVNGSATFNIFDNSAHTGTPIVETISFSGESSDFAIISGLILGKTYYVVEVSTTVAGATIDTTEYQPVASGAGTLVEVTFTNTKTTTDEGFIKITKVFKDQNNDPISVNGSVTFNIFDNINLTGTPIVETISFSGESSDFAIISGLILGKTYYVVEVSTTVSGATIDTTEYQPVASGAGSIVEVTFTNTKTITNEGFIKITKVFKDQNNDPISVNGSATFNIFDNSAHTGTPIVETISFSGESSDFAIISGLILGKTYYVVEVSTTVAGATIDTTEYQPVASGAGTIVEVTFTNTKTITDEGFIKITKVFKDQNNDPISVNGSATFNIFDNSAHTGTPIVETISFSGESSDFAIISGLILGKTYYVVEVSTTVAGATIDTTEYQPVASGAGSIVEVTFTNTKTITNEGFIKITKVFKDQNNDPISVNGSATFNIFDNSAHTGTPIVETISFSGESSDFAIISGLILGKTYYVVEVSTTVAGATIDTTEYQPVASGAGTLVEVTFTNTKTTTDEGFIKITKVFKDQNNDPISVNGSVTFNIFDNINLTGTPIVETISFSGESSDFAIISGLILGKTYYVKEISTTVSGATIDTAKRPAVASGAGSIVEVTFTNTKTITNEGFIKITKVFKDQNNDPISVNGSATFNIFDNSAHTGTPIVETISFSGESSDFAIISGLILGKTYYVVEVSTTVAGATIDTTEYQPVASGAGTLVEVTFTNTKTTTDEGFIKITKVFKDQNNDPISVNGSVTFNIFDNSAHTGTPIVETISFSGESSDFAIISGLILGKTYYVVEVSTTVAGATIDTTEYQPVASGAGTLVEVTFTNTKTTTDEGFIKITKVFKDQNNDPISVNGSVTFNIFDNINLTGTPIVETISFSGESSDFAIISGLILGKTYYVVEVSTTVAGATIDTTEYQPVASGAGTLVEVTFTNTKTITDEGFIKITKVFKDQNNDPISVNGSATFNIFDNSAHTGTPIVETISFSGESSDFAIISGLILGKTYYVVEVSTTVSGATIDTTEYQPVASGAGSIVEVTFTNTKTITNEGFIKITKVFKDQNNDPISVNGSATFNIFDNSAHTGTPIVETISFSGESSDFAIISGLILGKTYYVVEVSTTVAGATIDTTEYQPVASGAGTIVEVTFTNTKTITNEGFIKITKVFKDQNNDPISVNGSATFNIFDNSAHTGTPIVETISFSGESSDFAIISGLILGKTYYVVEVSTTVAGATIDTTEYQPVASGAGSIVEVTFTNTKTILGSIHITKSLIGGLTGGIYTFSIVANDAGSTWTHPDVTINLDDTDLLNDSVLITNVPLGSYTVTEIIPGGATYHVTVPSGGIYAAILTAANPDATAAFTNASNNYSVSVQKATIGTGFTGSFNFELQKTSNGVDYATVSTLTISSSGGTASFPSNTSNPIIAGTYRVVETGSAGATYTSVSNLGIPAAPTSVNTVSPSFVLSETNTSQTVYFVNSIPGTGAIMIVKNVTVTQGTNTTFTFTISPAVNGISTYYVVVPANQVTGTFTINNVSIYDNVKYTISENSLPGWFVQSAEGLTFTLSPTATLATPVFTNTPVGGGTTTTVLTVAGISTGPAGGIQVLGISNLPFTGSRDTLFKFGMVFIIFGLMMMIFLPIFLRAGKHMRTI